jgi:hypothetical protein
MALWHEKLIVAPGIVSNEHTYIGTFETTGITFIFPVPIVSESVRSLLRPT